MLSEHVVDLSRPHGSFDFEYDSVVLGIVLDSGLDSGALCLVLDCGVFGLVLDPDAKQGLDSGMDSNKSVIES